MTDAAQAIAEGIVRRYGVASAFVSHYEAKAIEDITQALDAFAATQTAALRAALQACVDGWMKGDDVQGPMQRARVLLAAREDRG